MKLNTHDRTPKPKTEKTIIALFVLGAILIYGVFGLMAFACFCYADNVAAGIFVIALPLLITAVVLIDMRDLEKAYVEIDEKEVHIVDYYFGIKKEKRFLLDDITRKEILPASSREVKGRRISNGMRYICFYHNEEYLFKIMYFPETAEMLKGYIKITE